MLGKSAVTSVAAAEAVAPDALSYLSQGCAVATPPTLEHVLAALTAVPSSTWSSPLHSSRSDDVSLTERAEMKFRMIVGRHALRGHNFVVHPGRRNITTNPGPQPAKGQVS